MEQQERKGLMWGFLPDLPSGLQCNCWGRFPEQRYWRWWDPCLLSADWSERADGAAPPSAQHPRSPEPGSEAYRFKTKEWKTQRLFIKYILQCTECLNTNPKLWTELTSSSWCEVVPPPASSEQTAQRWAKGLVSHRPTLSQLCFAAHVTLAQMDDKISVLCRNEYLPTELYVFVDAGGDAHGNDGVIPGTDEHERQTQAHAQERQSPVGDRTSQVGLSGTSTRGNISVWRRKNTTDLKQDGRQTGPRRLKWLQW